MMMYTDPGHIHVNDPGKVEGNVVFTYLDIFDKDKVVLKKLKEDYKKGGLGDVVIKKRLITILEDLIGPIREKRNELAKNPKEIDNILKEGIKKARITAKETMERVRKAIKIDYF
jgi:tryptophanyl-tRNA synthetase